MRTVFLDYATVSFHGDLDPASLQRAMPGLELREHTSQDDVAGAIAGAGDRAAEQAAHLTRASSNAAPT